MIKFHYFNITYECDSNCIFCAANIGLVNNAGYTMNTIDFEENLKKNQVEKGDRVMISGGEPTLSPFFWDILDVCEKYQCCIDLTTNGHFFANIANVERILRYSKVVIRIPIFGIGNYHDYLTGNEGNYEKTINALDNFYMKHTKNLVVNIKFLLSKATLDSNEETYELMYSRYGNRFEYTLSPILVSKKVQLNADILMARYSELIAKSQDFINKQNLNCDIIPLCLLNDSKIQEFLTRKKIDFSKFYADEKINYSNIDNYSCDKCNLCKLNKYCNKFLPSYISYYGNDEIKPFL